LRRQPQSSTLLAGYGPAHWVLNARAAGEVTLSRRGRSETYKVEEAGAEDAIPVLREYIAEIRVTRPYFDAARRWRERNRG
jgi:hypothetical protein